MSGYDQLNKIFKKFSKNAKKDKKMKKKIGKSLAKMIRLRILDGFGVRGDGDKKHKFKELKQSTKDSRKKKKLASTTSPNKSNQTESGNYTDSIRSKVKGEEVIIEPNRKAQKYIKHQADDRPSFYLSDKEMDFVEDEISKYLDDILK